MPPIDGDKLILLVIEAMPGQPNIRVWNNDAFKRGVVELPRVRSFDECMVVAPIPVDGKNQPAARRWQPRATELPASNPGASVLPAMTVLVVFKKSRRSIVLPLRSALAKTRREDCAANLTSFVDHRNRKLGNYEQRAAESLIGGQNSGVRVLPQNSSQELQMKDLCSLALVCPARNYLTDISFSGEMKECGLTRI